MIEKLRMRDWGMATGPECRRHAGGGRWAAFAASRPKRAAGARRQPAELDGLRRRPVGLEALPGACTVERAMKRLAGARKRGPVSRAIDKFMADPSSGRNAILLIVVANLATVVVGGLAIWLLDRRDFEHLTEAFWYILQTITTVGYGDVTPIDPLGRLIGAGVMLLGIAFISILTATITSSLVEARQAERRARNDAEQDEYQARVEGRLDTIIERLDRIESAEAQREGTEPV